jgi:hypothetical protein
MNDAEAFEYYDDPAKREPAAGPPQRRADLPSARHVPVRSSLETIRQVERRARGRRHDGKRWIRRAVDETLRRRDSFGPASR